MDKDKEIRSDAKLKNLPEQALEDLWAMRYPGEDGTKLSLEDIAVEIPLRYGLTVSISTVSEFYSWLRLKKRLAARANLSDQLKLEMAKDPHMTEEQMARAGQRLFMAESIIEKDARVFADLVKIGQNDQRIKQNDEKIGLDKRRLKLLEDNAAEAKAKLLAVTTAAKSSGGLTPETLKQIEEAAGLL